jgi:hypothetical protein
MEILGTEVKKGQNHVAAIVTVDSCPSNPLELRSLWTPPEGILYKELLAAGYISADGTVLRHFRREDVVAKPIGGGKYQLNLRFTLVHDKN